MRGTFGRAASRVFERDERRYQSDKKRTKIVREREREREQEQCAPSVVARGEDASPSENSLVTMNGPNESREPIKDYSRRRGGRERARIERLLKLLNLRWLPLNCRLLNILSPLPLDRTFCKFSSNEATDER